MSEKQKNDKKPVVILSQALVTRYTKYYALKNLLENWLKKQRETILQALQSGQKCPNKGPYVIELGDAEARPEWKEEFRKYLWKSGKTEEQAENILQAIAKKPRPKELRVYCKPNPLYRVKVVPKLPAA